MEAPERRQLSIEEALDALRDALVTHVEFVSGGTDRDEDDYLVLRFDHVTLYASAPAVYSEAAAPVETSRDGVNWYVKREDA